MSNERLFQDFPAVTDEQWRAAIERDLKGADFEKKLVWRASPGIDVLPFYRRSDLEKLEYLRAQAPGAFPFVRGNNQQENSWLICQPIGAPNPEVANASARRALGAGADTLSFHLAVTGQHLSGTRVLSLADFEALVLGIDITHVPLHFGWGQATPQAAAYLQAYCEPRRVPTAEIHGSFGFDPLAELAKAGRVPQNATEYWDSIAAYLKQSSSTFPQMKQLMLNSGVYLEAGSNLAQDLALILAEMTELLDALTERGFAPEAVFGWTGITVAVSSSYFLEIAFVRALRLLWSALAEAYGVQGQGAKTFVRAESCRLNKTLYDPHVNILRETTEAMSAVIAGVDVLSLMPWDELGGNATEASERLARNTQLVIRHESGLEHAIDAAAGSYYLETLTDQLASRGWSLFQELEAAGGFLRALETGVLASWLSASRSTLDKGVATRQLSVLGTNQFPSGSEVRSPPGSTTLLLTSEQLRPCPRDLKAMVDAAPSGLPLSDPFSGPTRAVGALVATRLAEKYEQLRLVVDALPDRPVVYLWTYGDLTLRKARAGFCQNLYSAAGLKVVEGPGTLDPEPNLKLITQHKPRWVVFCSSDAEYPSEVPALVGALRDREPKPVTVVAGLPKDSVELLQGAGVSEFVHVKTNALDYLGACVNRLKGES